VTASSAWFEDDEPHAKSISAATSQVLPLASPATTYVPGSLGVASTVKLAPPPEATVPARQSTTVAEVSRTSDATLHPGLAPSTDNAAGTRTVTWTA
jgi:hypothetical protein